MKYLTRTAARDFHWAIRASFHTGIASWTETMDRVAALREMCEPASSYHTLADRLLKLEDWSPERTDWPEQSEQENEDSEGNGTPSRLVRTRRRADGDGYEDDPYIWQYFASSATGLSGWEFYQYDDDPYPSVPHGHKKSNSRWKLDAYQGWVYERTRQAHREPRWKIVALWNDRDFRRFALTAITYHLEHYPHHNDWPVANPLRLPRPR